MTLDTPEFDRFVDWLIYTKGIEPAEADGIALGLSDNEPLPDSRRWWDEWKLNLEK